MKIITKFVLAALTSTALVFALDGYLHAQSKVAALQTDRVQDIQMLARVLENILADAGRTYGQTRVKQLIADANAGSDKTRFSWIPFGTLTASPARLEIDQQQIDSLQRGKRVWVTGQETLQLYVPVMTGNETSGVLKITDSLAAVNEYTHRTMLQTLVVWGGLMPLNGGLLLLIGMVMIGRPIRRVIEKTRRVGTGDLEGPLEFRTHDEFAEVATAMNQMCEQLKASQEAVQTEIEARLKTLEQLRHADRLKTIGVLVTGFAHELGTPLNVISGRAGLITMGRLSLADVTDSARIIKEQVHRVTGIIRQLLDFARRQTPKRAAVDLGGLTRQTVEMLGLLAEPQHVALVLKADETPVSVQVDAGQIQQVLINLVANAWQAMPQGGQIEIGVYPTKGGHPPAELASREGCWACVSVTDQGEGIPAEDIPHIFDPFFTTKDVGQGTGLGLSVAYGIVRDHGGWLDVVSRPGAGACFSVYLPMEEEPCLDAS